MIDSGTILFFSRILSPAIWPSGPLHHTDIAPTQVQRLWQHHLVQWRLLMLLYSPSVTSSSVTTFVLFCFVFFSSAFISVHQDIIVSFALGFFPSGWPFDLYPNWLMLWNYIQIEWPFDIFSDRMTFDVLSDWMTFFYLLFFFCCCCCFWRNGLWTEYVNSSVNRGLSFIQRPEISRFVFNTFIKKCLINIHEILSIILLCCSFHVGFYFFKIKDTVVLLIILYFVVSLLESSKVTFNFLKKLVTKPQTNRIESNMFVAS